MFLPFLPLGKYYFLYSATLSMLRVVGRGKGKGAAEEGKRGRG